MTDTTENKETEQGMEQHFYRASAEDFGKIPGSPIGYWIGKGLKEVFSKSLRNIGNIADPNQALVTGNTELYIRKWSEVSFSKVGLSLRSRDDANNSGKRWFPYNKGGDYRNWYGNFEHLIDWSNDGKDLQTTLHPSGKRVWAHNFVLDKIFKEALVWSKITSGKPCFRYSPSGHLYDDASGVCSFINGSKELLLGILCSKVNIIIQGLVNPTLNIQPENLRSIPLPLDEPLEVNKFVNNILDLSKNDWDSYERSWGFISLPILRVSSSLVKSTYFPHSPVSAWECIHSTESTNKAATLEYGNRRLNAAYQILRSEWQAMTDEMQQLEQENNRIFIEAYRLQDELTPEVPLNEITLTCNPHYRYGANKTDEELETLLRADTMREFISYALGCMFGRYSLDKEGLILANQGDSLEDYLKQVPEPQFIPDDDNVIPLINFDGDWFEDDITERFKRFLKVTFGEENFAENLAFIEAAIGKDIKKFFLKDFYTDHVKRYKKRPIYWMFSSPKGSFNALIYMHRYRPDTVSVVLNDYLREFRTKLQARKESHEQIEVSASASAKEKTQAIKAVQKINKVLDEINDYEHDTLYPLAGKPPEIDLDDGVKHNYPLFGKALKKVTGLS